MTSPDRDHVPRTVTDGGLDIEDCARASEDRTFRLGAAVYALVFEARDEIRVI